MLKKLMIYETLKQAQERPNTKLDLHVKTDVCRLCMGSNIKMVGIFDCVNRNLAKDIQFCTGILVQETGDLPKKICTDCLAQLKIAFIFKNKCLRTENILNKQYSTVKTEFNKTEIEIEDKTIFLAKQEKHKKTKLSLPTGRRKENTVFLAPQEKQEKVVTLFSPQNNQEKTFLSSKKTQENATILLTSKEKQENTGLSHQAVTYLSPKEEQENAVTLLSTQEKQEKTDNLLTPKENQEEDEVICSPIVIVKIEMEREENRAEIGEEEDESNVNEEFDNDCHSPLSIKDEDQSKDGEPPICYICDIEFPTEEDRQCHNNEKDHKANIKKLLRNPSKLKGKQRKRVPEKICEICGVMIVGLQNIWRHIKMHKPPEWICDQCDYKSHFQGDFNKHKMTHLEKQYQCGYCAKMFTFSFNLRDHVKRIHENDGVKKFKCTICNSEYTNSTSLKRHTLSHLNARNFECKVCYSRFNTRKHWKRHMKNLHKIILPVQKPGRRPNSLYLKTKSEDLSSSAPFSEFVRNKEQ